MSCAQFEKIENFIFWQFTIVNMKKSCQIEISNLKRSQADTFSAQSYIENKDKYSYKFLILLNIRSHEKHFWQQILRKSAEDRSGWGILHQYYSSSCSPWLPICSTSHYSSSCSWELISALRVTLWAQQLNICFLLYASHEATIEILSCSLW